VREFKALKKCIVSGLELEGVFSYSELPIESFAVQLKEWTRILYKKTTRESIVRWDEGKFIHLQAALMKAETERSRTVVQIESHTECRRRCWQFFSDWVISERQIL